MNSNAIGCRIKEEMELDKLWLVCNIYKKKYAHLHNILRNLWEKEK